MDIKRDILETVGGTPLVWLNSINREYGTKIAGKLEFFNPGSSVKDRISVKMIEDAEKSGILSKDSRIVEPTSGNTGIGLAIVCAVKGYRLTLIMPESASVERVKLMKFLGAEVILTPADRGMQGSIDEALAMAEKDSKVFIPYQFKNPSNPEAHREKTSREVWDATDGEIDIFVAGVGTGGTITGVGEVLKKRKPSLKVVAVEPEKSAVLSGGQPGKHKIQGIGAGFVPEVLNTGVIDEIVKVKDEDAIGMSRRLALKDGILCGISSGAAVHAAVEIGKKNKDKLIVVVLPATAERYLSTDLFDI